MRQEHILAQTTDFPAYNMAVIPAIGDRLGAIAVIRTMIYRNFHGANAKRDDVLLGLKHMHGVLPDDLGAIYNWADMIVQQSKCGKPRIVVETLTRGPELYRELRTRTKGRREYRLEEARVPVSGEINWHAPGFGGLLVPWVSVINTLQNSLQMEELRPARDLQLMQALITEAGRCRERPRNTKNEELWEITSGEELPLAVGLSWYLARNRNPRPDPDPDQWGRYRGRSEWRYGEGGPSPWAA